MAIGLALPCGHSVCLPGFWLSVFLDIQISVNSDSRNSGFAALSDHHRPSPRRLSLVRASQDAVDW